MIASGKSFAETARQTGINESTMRSWAKREYWFIPRKNRPPEIQIQMGPIATNPADILDGKTMMTGQEPKTGEDIIENLKAYANWGLSAFAKRAAQSESTMERFLKTVADMIRAMGSLQDKGAKVETMHREVTEELHKRLAKLSIELRPPADEHAQGIVPGADTENTTQEG